MQRLNTEGRFPVFLFFFALALLEALFTQHWPEVVFWLIVGVLFFLSDYLPDKM